MQEQLTGLIPEQAGAGSGMSDHERLMLRLTEHRGRQLGGQLVVLEHEFDGRVPPEEVVATSDQVLERLLDSACFTDFVPVLTYRYTKELLQDAQNQRAA